MNILIRVYLRSCVDAIICARNERARTFVPVIRALKQGAGGTVILVDDGNNRGLWLGKLAGARVIQGFDGDGGKSAAMRMGLAEFAGLRDYDVHPDERVIFCDADLTGFRKEHARRLAEPSGGMVVGLRDNGSKWLGPFPAVTGERSVPYWVASGSLYSCRGWECELSFDATVGNAGLPVETFVMNGCRNPRKDPIRRAGQVLSAAPRYLLGLIRYVVSWLRGAVVFHV